MDKSNYGRLNAENKKKSTFPTFINSSKFYMRGKKTNQGNEDTYNRAVKIKFSLKIYFLSTFIHYEQFQLTLNYIIYRQPVKHPVSFIFHNEQVRQRN